MTLSANIGTIRLTRFPEPARREDYEAASAEMERSLRVLPGLVALYRAGSVSAPGISDIDFVAVVKGDAPAPDMWKGLSERTRYLAMHAPGLVDVATFLRHPWIAHLDLCMVYGRELDVERPPLDDYANVLIAAEGALSVLLRFTKAAVSGVIKVRPFLCELNSLRYDLELAGIERDEARHAWSVVDEVARVRNSWFELPDPPSALRALIANTLPALVEAVDRVSARASEMSAARAPGPFPLPSPWQNVTVVEADRVRVTPSEPLAAALLRVPVASRRLAEMRWRLARLEIGLPPALVALLCAAPPEAATDFSDGRRELIHRYLQFMSTMGRGYSPISHALIFAQL